MHYSVTFTPNLNPTEWLFISYELTNHLGNVLSVISDKVIPHDNGAGNTDYYLADIRQATDYSPFGVTLSGRNITLTGAEKFRFGFNGMEQDDEIKGDRNSYDFGARILDPRIGRWLTIDPSFFKYPEFSAYNFVANSPLLFVDPDGKEIILNYTDGNGKVQSYKYTPGVKPTINNESVQKFHEAVTEVMKYDDDKVFQSLSADKSPVIIEFTSSLDSKVANSTAYSEPTFDARGNANESTMAAKIVWNPGAMMETVDDFGNPTGGISASTILLHEGAHAKAFLDITNSTEHTDWKNAQNGYPSTDPKANYDNKREYDVISGTETKYLNKMNAKYYAKNNWKELAHWTEEGKYYTKVSKKRWEITYQEQESVRYNHRGTLHQSTGVNSINRADAVKVKGQTHTVKKVITKIAGPKKR